MAIDAGAALKSSKQLHFSKGHEDQGNDLFQQLQEKLPAAAAAIYLCQGNVFFLSCGDRGVKVI